MGTHPIFESDFDCLTDNLNKMSAELACTYAALILQDDEIEITADKISTLLKAAKVDVEPFWPGLCAGALKDVDVKGLITNIGSGVGGSVPTAGGAPAEGGAGAADEAPAEAAKEDSGSDSDDSMGFGLFEKKKQIDNCVPYYHGLK